MEAQGNINVYDLCLHRERELSCLHNLVVLILMYYLQGIYIKRAKVFMRLNIWLQRILHPSVFWCYFSHFLKAFRK